MCFPYFWHSIVPLPHPASSCPVKDIVCCINFLASAVNLTPVIFPFMILTDVIPKYLALLKMVDLSWLLPSDF